MYRWLKRVIIVGIPAVIILWIGAHYEIIRISSEGIEVMHEEEMSPALLIRRGNLYFHLYKNEDALRCYSKAMFNAKTSLKEPLKMYSPREDEVNLAHIADYYDLDKKAKSIPGISEALFNMALCYTNLGRVKEAIMVYKGFLDLFPQDGLAAVAQRNMEDLRVNKL